MFWARRDHKSGRGELFSIILHPPKVDGFDHFEFGNHKALKKAITNKTAAIMVEPVLGEGGIKVIPDWCLRELRKICNQKKYY